MRLCALVLLAMPMGLWAAEKAAENPVRRSAAEVLKDFKLQDSNLTGEMTLVKEYSTALAYLEKLTAPNEQQKKQLEDYDSIEHLEQIVYHAKEVLSSYREEYDERPATRESELRALTSRVNYLGNRLLRRKAKWREPTKEEQAEIDAYLKDVIALVDKKEYEKLTKDVLWVEYIVNPEITEQERKKWEKAFEREWGALLKQIIGLLTATPVNRFVFTDAAGNKCALLLLAKADLNAKLSEYKGIHIKWRKEGKRIELTWGFYDPKDTGPIWTK